MSAITKVNTTNGRKNPIPKREPVAAYESMLGPSFSPSMTRMPGPTRSHKRRNLERMPRQARAANTRSRSCARSMSSWVMTTSVVNGCAEDVVGEVCSEDVSVSPDPVAASVGDARLVVIRFPWRIY